MQLEQRIKQEVEDNIVLEEDATPEEEQEKISVDDYIRGDDTPGYKSRVNNYSKDEKQRPMNISEGRSQPVGSGHAHRLVPCRQYRQRRISPPRSGVHIR